MASNSKKPSPFDVKTVEELIALMSANDLSEIYLRDGAQHLRLRRGVTVMPTSVHTSASMPIHHAAPVANAMPAPAAPNKNLIEIRSETVGTFYAQAKPGEPPFVKLGDRVTPNTAVGVIVVMKTNNEILANCTGVVAEVCVKDEQFVDFGQVLFRVDPI